MMMFITIFGGQLSLGARSLAGLGLACKRSGGAIGGVVRGRRLCVCIYVHV